MTWHVLVVSLSLLLSLFLLIYSFFVIFCYFFVTRITFVIIFDNNNLTTENYEYTDTKKGKKRYKKE